MDDLYLLIYLNIDAIFVYLVTRIWLCC